MSPVAASAVTAASTGPAHGTKTRPRLAPRTKPLLPALARRRVRKRRGRSGMAPTRGTSNVTASTSRSAIARSRRKSSGSPSASRSDAPATVKTVKLPTSPAMIPYGLRPDAPPARRIGSTGRTHGEIAVIRPASTAIPMSTTIFSPAGPLCCYGLADEDVCRQHDRAAGEEDCRDDVRPPRAGADATLGLARRAPVEERADGEQSRLGDDRAPMRLPQAEADAEVSRVPREDRHVVPVDDQVEDPVREDDTADDGAAAPTPPPRRDPPGDESDHAGADKRVRPVGVDDHIAVTTVRPRGVLDLLHTGREQRDRGDVQPHRRHHQRPQRNGPLARLDAGS